MATQEENESSMHLHLPVPSCVSVIHIYASFCAFLCVYHPNICIFLCLPVHPSSMCVHLSVPSYAPVWQVGINNVGLENCLLYGEGKSILYSYSLVLSLFSLSTPNHFE